MVTEGEKCRRDASLLRFHAISKFGRLIMTITQTINGGSPRINHHIGSPAIRDEQVALISPLASTKSASDWCRAVIHFGFAPSGLTLAFRVGWKACEIEFQLIPPINPLFPTARQPVITRVRRVVEPWLEKERESTRRRARC